MPTFSRLSPWPRKWLLWALAGLALRLLLIWFPRPFDDDTTDYLQLGHNLFHHAVYGHDVYGMENSEPRYTLECFPVLIVASAAALASLPVPASVPFRGRIWAAFYDPHAGPAS